MFTIEFFWHKFICASDFLISNIFISCTCNKIAVDSLQYNVSKSLFAIISYLFLLFSQHLQNLQQLKHVQLIIPQIPSFSPNKSNSPYFLFLKYLFTI